MRFYMAPGSCSTGIHILLEELELVFEAHVISLPAGDHLKPDYICINPKTTIPALELDDGRVLTEFQSIAYWLARHYPQAKLLSGDIDEDTKAIETMAYVVNTLHGQGFARIFVPEQFAQREDDYSAVIEQGHARMNQAFAIVNDTLQSDDYLTGHFSIADAALFYVEFWADKLNIDLPVNCARHYQTMLNRPVVQRVLLEEGYALPPAHDHSPGKPTLTEHP